MSRASHRDAIHALLDAGLDLKSISERLVLKESTVFVHRTYWRKVRKLGPLRYGPRKRKLVVELDKQGLSIPEIAARMGISREAVASHRRLAGLPRKEVKSPGATGKTWKKEAVQVPDLGRCRWCGLSNPCTCTGPRHATDHMGRREEPNFALGNG